MKIIFKLKRKLLPEKISFNFFKQGSALILTMFVLVGMMVVALSGSYIVLAGIKSGGIQSQSVKAYFAAESGAERLLYELRVNNLIIDPDISSDQPILEEESLTEPSYHVFLINRSPSIYHSVGEYNKSKRSVELKI